MNTYCYHGRNTQGQKMFGGTVSATGWDGAVEASTRGLEVGISPSGRSIWVDKEGREVDLYLCLSPELTERGGALLKVALQEKAKRDAIEWERENALEANLSSLLDSMSVEQAIERLKGVS